MPDRRRVVLIGTNPRSGVWPGGEAVCLRLTITAEGATVGEGMWLYRRDGTVHELQPYRYGMLGRR